MTVTHVTVTEWGVSCCPFMIVVVVAVDVVMIMAAAAFTRVCNIRGCTTPWVNTAI